MKFCMLISLITFSFASASTVASGAKSGTPAEDLSLHQGRDFEVVQFEKASSTLSETAMAGLKTVIETANQAGSVQHVHVAVWSDEPFPHDKMKRLSKDEEKLAVARINSLERYLKDTLKTKKLKFYNLARHSSWFARGFNTNEAELKSLFNDKGAPSNVTPASFRIVKEKGGPMKAVVLIEMKDSSLKPKEEGVGTSNQ